MLKKSIMSLTLGGNYWCASILYCGLSLLVLGLTPAMPTVYATSEDCPEGMTLVWYGEAYWCECQED